MKRALLRITPEDICRQFLLPEDTEIDSVSWDPIDRTVVLSVRHHSLPEVPPRHHAMNVRLRHTYE